MIKVAILTTGDLKDMKGVMNYVNEKNYQFIINNDGSYSTSCFFLQFEYSCLARCLFRLLGKRDFKHFNKNTEWNCNISYRAYKTWYFRNAAWSNNKEIL